MSLFPSARALGDGPSTSRVPEVITVEDNAPYQSYDLALINKRRLEAEKKKKIEARKQEVLEDFAVRTYTIGAGTDEDSDEDETLAAIVGVKDKVLEKYARDKMERENKRKRKRRSSSSSSSSSDDSSRKKKKKKKKRKHRRRSSSSDSRSPKKSKTIEKLQTSDKYEFLKTIPSYHTASYFVMHRKIDYDIRRESHVISSELSIYRDAFRNVLGGTVKIDKLFFGKDAKSRQQKLVRYFGRIQYSTDPECFFVPNNAKMEGFVELSKKRAKIDHLLDKNYDQTQADKEALKNMQEVEDISNHSVFVRHTILNSRLARDPKNEQLWLDFIALEAEYQAALHNTSKMAILERKLEIVKKALAKIPGSQALLDLKMKYLREIQTPDEAISEFKKQIHTRPNSWKMWMSYVDYLECQIDNAKFDLMIYEGAIRDGQQTLGDIVSGRMRSHKPLPGTERAILDLFFRRIRMLLHAGMTEKAVASVQIHLEGSFRPGSGDIGDFFDSQLPMIGSQGALGWARMDEMTVTMDSAAVEDSDRMKKIYDRVGSDEGTSNDLLYLEFEREKSKYLWRPIRTLDDSDSDGYVSFGDTLYHSIDPSLHLELVMGVVELFGGSFYRVPPLLEVEWLMDEFGLTDPSIFRFPASFHSFVDRILQFFSTGEQFFKMAFARLRSKSAFISMDDSLSALDRLREMELFSRNGFRDYSKRQIGDQLSFFYLVWTTISSREQYRLIDDSSETKVHARWMRTFEKVVDAIMKADGSGRRPLSEHKLHNRHLILLAAFFLCQSRDVSLGGLLRVLRQSEDSSDPVEVVLIQQQLEACALKELRLEETEKMRDSAVSYDNILNELNVTFGSRLFLMGVLRMNLAYAASVMTSEERLMESHQVYVQYIPALPPHEQEKMAEQYAKLLERFANDYASPRALRMFLTATRTTYPNNAYLLRKYIDWRMKGPSAVVLFADLKKLSNSSDSAVLSVARIYAARLHFHRVHAFAENIKDTLRMFASTYKVYKEEAARLKSPLLWRHLLRWVMYSPSFVDEVHTLGTAQCVYSRDLHLDMAFLSHSHIDTIKMLLLEKNLRIRAVEDEIDLLREKHRNETGPGPSSHSRPETARIPAKSDEAMDTD